MSPLPPNCDSMTPMTMNRRSISHTQSLSKFFLAFIAAIVLTGAGRYGWSQSPAASFDDLQAVARGVSLDAPIPETSIFDHGWWTPHVGSALQDQDLPQAITLEQTIVEALQHSEQIKVFSELPLIRETAVIEASSAFDWNHFMDTRWDDVSEPIGNSLTAGAGATRFNDHNWTGRTGLRRRTVSGGTFDVSQQFGFQDNNSQFFVPDPQGTARLVLGFTQPLMRGRGKVYNKSLIVLAQIDKNAAKDEFRRQTESHLLEVTRAYWALYLERAAYFQRINLYLRGKQILDRLEARSSLDAADVQVAAARAAVASRQSDLVRAKAAVANAQARLRSLVNSPTLVDVEVLPSDVPTLELSQVNLDESVAIAFQRRPEVLQAIKQNKAACVRLNMSRNELMPVLNLVTQTYLSGLEDQGDSLAAFSRQFDTGSPSYGIGLVYERPVGNRAAKARLRRRRLELRQIEHQYATTLENIRYEVAVGVNELRTSLQELSTKSQALASRQRQLEALQLRWTQLPPRQNGAALALQDLLETQATVANAEYEYLSAQLTYNLALVNLKKVTGTLLSSENINLQRYCECNLPSQQYSKDFSLGMIYGDEPSSPMVEASASPRVTSHAVSAYGDPVPGSPVHVSPIRNASSEFTPQQP